MSLRQSLALHQITCKRLFNTASIPRSAPRDSGFGELLGITSSSSSSSSSPSSSSLTTTQTPFFSRPQSGSEKVSGRGYLPGHLPAPVEPTLDLFTNMLMKHGKKGEAQRHVSTILSLLQSATNSPPVPLLRRAIELSSPYVRMLSMRKSAKTIQTPRALNERQRTRQGIVWLLKAAERGRSSGIRRDDRIAREVLAVLEGTSDVFKRLEEVHRIATMNRSNLHTR